MKWKIQTRSVNGWADLKISEDDGQHFWPELFDSVSLALEELDEVARLTLDDKDNYRVVMESTPSDDNLY